MTRKLIRTDGTEVEYNEPLTIAAIQKLINADWIDMVSLRHMGKPLQVMCVADGGMVDGKPVNVEASRLYWANCKPGTVSHICGDVFICPDIDFENIL